jgi:hypothetical protein
MSKHLWEVKHEYYCNLGNYYANGCGDSFETFDAFLEAWGNPDMDYNLLFRWDWEVANAEDEKDHDSLNLFWMLQRKGAYRFTEIKVTKADEPKVLAFLKPRFEYMKALWTPVE